MWSPRCGFPDVVSHLPPRCGFPDVVSELPPKFLHLLSSLPLVSQMWFPRCCLPVLLLFNCLLYLQGFLGCCLVVFHVSPRCGLKIVFNCLPQFRFVSQHWFSNASKCLPFVALLFPSCLSDVVSHLSPSCFGFVLQMWTSNCLPVCSRCALPILSQLSAT